MTVRYDFEDGDFWGNEILTDLEFHASAWIYWNMILDEKGGPWLVSPVHHDPEADVRIDEDGGPDHDGQGHDREEDQDQAKAFG